MHYCDSAKKKTAVTSNNRILRIRRCLSSCLYNYTWLRLLSFNVRQWRRVNRFPLGLYPQAASLTQGQPCILNNCLSAFINYRQIPVEGMGQHWSLQTEKNKGASEPHGGTNQGIGNLAVIGKCSWTHGHFQRGPVNHIDNLFQPTSSQQCAPFSPDEHVNRTFCCSIDFHTPLCADKDREQSSASAVGWEKKISVKIQRIFPSFRADLLINHLWCLIESLTVKQTTHL